MIELLKSTLDENSNHRVRVLSGSPGLGKSTYALFSANLISKNNTRVINKISLSKFSQHETFGKRTFCQIPKEQKI